MLSLQVERREKGKEWQTVSQSLVKDTKYTCPCVSGKTYEFRVTAVNGGGEGEYCKATGPHLCREPIGRESCPHTKLLITSAPINHLLSYIQTRQGLLANQRLRK